MSSTLSPLDVFTLWAGCIPVGFLFGAMVYLAIDLVLWALRRSKG